MKDVTSSALELQTSEEDLSISRFYCLNNKHASLGQGGVRRGEAGGGVDLTNCITGHYRCSVIDYLYPYKTPGSPGGADLLG